MPNHVWNELRISDDALRAKVKELVGCVGENPVFDFNALIPYPQHLRERDESASRFDCFGKNYEKDDAIREKLIEAHVAKFGSQKDGYNSGGYEWCIKNWGTKWGAYNVSVAKVRNSEIIIFDTAWSMPTPIYEALERLFPEIEYVAEAFDGGGGWCATRTKYKDEPAILSEGKYSGRKGG